MNATSMRRLASDQASLRRYTPPNYLFPDGDDAALPDDLTQLTILLTGSQGTPFSQGLWRLHLRMPEDYPKNPPRATFKTRIYHPNVEENTGAVCLDTLKKDWHSKLTLRDILVTISCLLIHPNPDSALNSSAGSLLQEDYEAFARQARLMTSIHAPIPKALKDAVMEARRRGEEDGVGPVMETEERPTVSRAASSSASVVMKSKWLASEHKSRVASAQHGSVLEDDEQEDDVTPVLPLRAPQSPSHKKILGKRPLSELPTTSDLEDADQFDVSNGENLTPSEQNVNANAPGRPSIEDSSEPLKKSPKLSRSGSEKIQEGADLEIYEDNTSTCLGDEKENVSHAPSEKKIEVKKMTDTSHKTGGATRPTLRKVSNIGSSRGKGVPRVGIRRL